MTDLVIRPTTGSDWREVRTLRLEMLRDTPLAYLESLADALHVQEFEWRLRARRGQAKNGTSLVAITADGAWVGAMGGWIPDRTEGPILVGVYVAPTHRGRQANVADRLLDAIEEWAVDHGNALRLLVHEDNARAQAFYRRRGYELTGKSEPYALDPTQRELEMSRRLDSSNT